MFPCSCAIFLLGKNSREIDSWFNSNNDFLSKRENLREAKGEEREKKRGMEGRSQGGREGRKKS